MVAHDSDGHVRQRRFDDFPRVVVGICGGCWATMQWLSTIIERRIETLAAVNVDVEQARETLCSFSPRRCGWPQSLRDRPSAP